MPNPIYTLPNPVAEHYNHTVTSGSSTGTRFIKSSTSTNQEPVLWSRVSNSVEFLIGGNTQELALCPCDFSS